MIKVGKPPRMMKVIKEYEGSISLYAIEVNVTEYYVNKGSGYKVVNLGNDILFSAIGILKELLKNFLKIVLYY